MLGLLSTKSRTLWMILSQEFLMPMPTWRGLNKAAALSFSLRAMVVAVMRRSKEPAATGRSPPDRLGTPNKEAEENRWRMDSGTRPAATWFTRWVMAARVRSRRASAATLMHALTWPAL